MPIHDWTRVDAGIFHHFHQSWIGEITDVLNRRLLPKQYYALTEQHGAGYEPDVLTLKAGTPEPDLRLGGTTGGDRDEPGAGQGVLLAEPRARVRAETDMEFYRRRQSVVAVRHSSGDELVAIVEIVSKGNKAGRKAFEDFVRKAADFLQHQIHMLIVDLQPPTSRDPHGIHGALWEAITGDLYERPEKEPMTLAAYDASTGVRAFVEPVAVGDTLIEMPLFLAPRRHVLVPLEETYQKAFDSVPRRWRVVLEPETD